MSNEEKPITSRRERRLAQAALDSADQVRLTPEQAAAEARGRAEAEAAAQRERAEAEAAAQRQRAEAAAERERDAARVAAQRASEEAARREGPSSSAASAAASGSAPLRSRRAQQAAEPDQAHGERSSQARARDRAAQRVLRELAEKEQAAQSAQQAFPTRRSIRERETGKIPAVDTPPPGTRGTEGGATPHPVPASAAPSGPPRDAGPRPGPQPIPGIDPAPPTAMQGIIPTGLTVTPALGPETGSFRRLSHEQIAAARELLKEQAKNQAAMIDSQRAGNGTDVDPAVLAEQVAMAERAAILNRRAQAKQKLAEESRREAAAPARKAPAPAATDNLAMVTPLEFVHLPGVPHPVMKPPTTTHVPVVTGKTVRQAPRGTRSEPQEAAPVSARTAHGLEPLNASQTGAGRAERERMILLGVGAVGVLALIVAIIMIVLSGR